MHPVTTQTTTNNNKRGETMQPEIPNLIEEINNRIKEIKEKQNENEIRRIFTTAGLKEESDYIYYLPCEELGLWAKAYISANILVLRYDITDRYVDFINDGNEIEQEFDKSPKGAIELINKLKEVINNVGYLK